MRRALFLMSEYLLFFKLFLVPEKCAALVISKDVKAEATPILIGDKPIPVILSLIEKYLGGAVDYRFSWNATKVAAKLEDILMKVSAANIPLWIRLKCLREWLRGAITFHFSVQPLKRSAVEELEIKVMSTLRSWFRLFPGHTMYAFQIERVEGGEGVIDVIGLQQSAMIRACDYLLHSDHVDANVRKVFQFGVIEAAKSCNVALEDFWDGADKLVVKDRVKNIWTQTAKILREYSVPPLCSKVYLKNRNVYLSSEWFDLKWQNRAYKHREKFKAFNPQLLDQPMGDRYLRWYVKSTHDTLFNCYRAVSPLCPCGQRNSQRHQLSQYQLRVEVLKPTLK